MCRFSLKIQRNHIQKGGCEHYRILTHCRTAHAFLLLKDSWLHSWILQLLFPLTGRFFWCATKLQRWVIYRTHRSKQLPTQRFILTHNNQTDVTMCNQFLLDSYSTVRGAPGHPFDWLTGSDERCIAQFVNCSQNGWVVSLQFIAALCVDWHERCKTPCFLIRMTWWSVKSE